MPRKKSRGRKPTPHEAFLFEIRSWKPEYTFSTNGSDDDDCPYSEHLELFLETVCVEPEKLAGRSVSLLLSSRRNYLDPPSRKDEQDGKPKSIGHLHVPPSGGGFYTGVPHESMSFLMTALIHGQFRYAMLSGPPLYRGQTSPTALNFMLSAE
jgi:hypothetical protein